MNKLKCQHLRHAYRKWKIPSFTLGYIEEEHEIKFTYCPICGEKLE